MSYSLRRLFGAALSATLIFSPTVSAYNDSALWFEHTDIQMPASATVAKLNNGLRFVILPTSRHSDEVSLRLRVGTDATVTEDYALALEAAESLVESTEWRALVTSDQIVFSLDLATADLTTLKQHLASIDKNFTQISSSSEFKSTLNAAQNVTLVVVGGISTRDTTEVIQSQFADWKRGDVTIVNRDSAIQLNAFLQSNPTSDTSFSVSTMKHLDTEQDSKLHRKEILLTTIANKMLEKRIQQAIEKQQSHAHVFVESDILFNHQLLSNLRVSDVSVDAKRETEKLVKTEIQRVLAAGFTQGEYEMAVHDLREQLKGQTHLGDDNYSAEQADRVIEAIRLGAVYTDPSYDLDLLNFHVAHLNEYDVNQAFEKTWSHFSGIKL